MDNSFHLGSSSFVGHTPQAIRGISGGDSYVGRTSQDFSYETFGADADMANSNLSAGSYRNDGTSLPPISLDHASYAANQMPSIANYTSTVSTYNNNYLHSNRPSHIQPSWPPSSSDRFHNPPTLLDPALGSLSNSFPMRTELGSTSSSQLAGSYSAADFGLGIQSQPELSNLSFPGSLPPGRPNLSIPFTPINASSFRENHSPSAIGESPSPVSIDESSFSPLGSIYHDNMSFHQRHESQPSLRLSPAAPISSGGNDEARNTALAFIPRAANQARLPQFTPYFDSHGRCIGFYPKSGRSSPASMTRTASEFPSSPSRPRSPSTGYEPSEAESNCTTPPTHYADPQYLSVPKSLASRQARRRSEPAPPLGHCSPHTMSRPHSSRSSRYAFAPRTPSLGLQNGEGPGSPISMMPRPARGKRLGGLPQATRDRANKKRVDRSVCIGCKISKIACEIQADSGVCSKCATQANNERKPFVCVSAYFLDHIHKTSTLMTTGPYVIEHTHTNGISRHRLELPASIDMVDLLHKIETWGDEWNIRVHQDNTHLYDLNLHACHMYLKSHGAPERSCFRKFINHLALNKGDNWRSCVRDASGHLKGDNPCETFITWNEAPNRFTYSVIRRLSVGNERPLDSRNEGDLQMIYAAAQLAFIIARKLELATYEYLQKLLIVNSKVTSGMLSDLGRILLSLRRRLIWWCRMGAGTSQQQSPNLDAESTQSSPYANNNNDDDDGDLTNRVPPVERVTKLCKVLYIYFCFMERRASYDVERPSKSTLQVSYPDSKSPVQEKFPTMESWSGYERWMQEGHRHFDESGVEPLEAAMDLSN
ncbi:hypothetical protein PT974_10524 [Cladobotryum mycophilum]|uniref:Zn(2)-C6 fungal-type domain-containing protein n=1 Tax=Cladobotryum mycophilum TaxID=491253 RepID=A0ABR0SAZ7_9HYPO